MRKYITSGNVGRFCQVMWHKGLEVILNKEDLSVKFSDGHYLFIPIASETTLIDLFELVDAEEKAATSASDDETPF